MRNICTLCGQELSWWDRAQGRFDHPHCRDHALRDQMEKLQVDPVAAPPASVVKNALTVLRLTEFNKVSPGRACGAAKNQVQPSA